MNLYITQDRIGTPTGGGAVTYHEYRAFSAVGPETHPIDNVRFAPWNTPFDGDSLYEQVVWGAASPGGLQIAHLYSGCFTKTVAALKRLGAKVTYTAAAHEIAESRKEFEALGYKFDLPHLTDPKLWADYVGGYVAADLVICPSTLSKRCMESYGCKNVKVIPHGCEIPPEVVPPPKTFTLGYLGQAGPDKGLKYLFAAWKKLGLKDARLVIAGNNVAQALPLWRQFGGGNVEFMGFVKHVSEFYNRVSVYAQPSVTEGFGIEVLEAMAYARPVIVSEGAGAADVVRDAPELGARTVAPRDVDALANEIENWYRAGQAAVQKRGDEARRVAAQYDWQHVRKTYLDVWRAMP